MNFAIPNAHKYINTLLYIYLKLSDSGKEFLKNFEKYKVTISTGSFDQSAITSGVCHEKDCYFHSNHLCY